MGVPKFFRWLSERYPLILQRHGCRVEPETFLEHYDQEALDNLKKTIPQPDPLSTCGLMPPQIDRLYIDMNGIIHGCSHNNQEEDSTEDDDADKLAAIKSELESGPVGRSEEDVFRDICYYLDRIVRDVAQPKELLYLAIDGVAPRAKLNQQRARRYRSSKEGEIEKTVYDAHLHTLEENDSWQENLTERDTDFGQNEAEPGSDEFYEKMWDIQSSFASGMNETKDESSLKEIEPGRFTGKFETHARKKDSTQSSHSEGSDMEVGDSEKVERFHSNAITPGTPFFQRCTQHLEHFIQRKISTDPAWEGLTVILSGSNTPGEGEHKIMQFMREQQSLPDYNPNLRHCIMGQDGDLIMLGLATHEPNLFLLRERVIFDQKRREAIEGVSQKLGLGVYLHNPHFELLHMNILRDYLALEFKTSNVIPGSPYDLERTIDDFVFMTFFVGNDFLPSLPALDIADDAFDLLFYTYRDQRMRWKKQKQMKEGPYMTNGGNIVSGKRLEEFLSTIGVHESGWAEFKKSTTNLDEIRAQEAKWGQQTTPSDEVLQAKEQSDQARYRQLLLESMKKSDKDSAEFVPAMSDSFDASHFNYEEEIEAKEQEGLMTRFGSLLQNSIQSNGGSRSSGQPLATINDKDFKGRYYADKFGFSPFDREKHIALRKAYIEGLVWTLQYYYNRTVSWEWFYSYHYGPMISDLVGLDKMLTEIRFQDEGTPLKPFEQLMACMPASNARLLPKPYRWLMTDASSPLKEFYPETFTVDMNGKRWPWEAVVLLPFIDAAKLRKEAAKVDQHLLTKEERKRNSVKEAQVYYRDDSSQRELHGMNSPGKQFSGLMECKTAAKPLSQTPWFFKRKKGWEAPSFKPQIQEGVQIPLDGLGTLRDGVVTTMKRRLIHVNVHGVPSRYHTCLLGISNDLPEVIPVETLAESLIGTIVYINYPHLIPAFVTAISDNRMMLRGKDPPRLWTSIEAAARKAKMRSICKSYMKGARLTGSGGMDIAGVDTEEAQVLLNVRPMKGVATTPDGTKGKAFARFEVQVPLFVTSWKPFREDARTKDLPVILEKNPFQVSSKRIVGLPSPNEAAGVWLRGGNDAIPGDPPSEKPRSQPHLTARAFSTSTSPMSRFSQSPELKGRFNRSYPYSSRKFHSQAVESVMFGERNIRNRMPTVRSKLLVSGFIAIAWLFSGATATLFLGPVKESATGSAASLKSLRYPLKNRGGEQFKQISPMEEAASAPLEFAHGTTTLAFSYQGGIVVAVDSRASLGTFIGSKTVQKVLPIHPHLLGTMAGGAADCSFWIRKIAAEAAFFEAQEGRRMSVVRASRILAQYLYQNRGAGLSMGTMIMGYDADSCTPYIFYVDDKGTRIEGDMFSVGSGSTFAISILDRVEDRMSLSTEDAIQLAVQAIRYATFRDSSSGGFINVYHCSPKGEWKRVFREDVASLDQSTDPSSR